VQVENALHMPVPPPDAQEPNDTPQLVRPAGSGLFGKPTLWSGGPERKVSATGDSGDDPVDGYRIQIPPHRSARVTLKPTAGQVNLFAFRGDAPSFNGRPLGSSTHPGLTPDELVLRNRTARRQTLFVVANSVADAGTRELSTYSLSVSGG
jgi:hypothetical protein